MALMNSIVDGLKDTFVLTMGGGAKSTPSLVFLQWGFSFVFLILYGAARQRMSRQKVFNYVVCTFLAFYIIFVQFLYPHANVLHGALDFAAAWAYQHCSAGFHGIISAFQNWTYTLFYIFAELWGDIGLSLLFYTFANEVAHEILKDKAMYIIPLFGFSANFAQIISGVMLACFRSNQKGLLSLLVILATYVIFEHNLASKLLDQYKDKKAVQQKKDDSLDDLHRHIQRKNSNIDSHLSSGQSYSSTTESKDWTSTRQLPPQPQSNNINHNLYSNGKTGVKLNSTKYSNGKNGNSINKNGQYHDISTYIKQQRGLQKNLAQRIRDLRRGHVDPQPNGYQNGKSQYVQNLSRGSYRPKNGSRPGVTATQLHDPKLSQSEVPVTLTKNIQVPSNWKQSYTMPQQQQKSKYRISYSHQAHNQAQSHTNSHTNGTSHALAPGTSTFKSQNGTQIQKPEETQEQRREEEQVQSQSVQRDEMSGDKMNVFQVLWTVAQDKVMLSMTAIAFSQGIISYFIDFHFKYYSREMFVTPAAYQQAYGRVQIVSGLFTFALMFLASFLFQQLKWKGVANLTPHMITILGSVFFTLCLLYNFHIHTFINPQMQLAIIVVTGACLWIVNRGSKFGLFKPAEELVYVNLNLFQRQTGKAAIDVFGVQTGKMIASFLTQVMLIVGKNNMSPLLGATLVTFCVMMGLWKRSVEVIWVKLMRKDTARSQRQAKKARLERK